MPIDFTKAVWCGALAAGLLITTMPSAGAQDQASTRRIVNKVAAVYPVLAQSSHLTGAVKLLAFVTPEGAVKSVRTLGGNPLLVIAAEQAVKQWKYQPLTKETIEPVTLRFASPQ